MAQEGKQALGLAGTRTEVDVRQEDRANTAWRNERIRISGNSFRVLLQQEGGRASVEWEIGELQFVPAGCSYGGKHTGGLLQADEGDAGMGAFLPATIFCR